MARNLDLYIEVNFRLTSFNFLMCSANPNQEKKNEKSSLLLKEKNIDVAGIICIWRFASSSFLGFTVFELLKSLVTIGVVTKALKNKMATSREEIMLRGLPSQLILVKRIRLRICVQMTMKLDRKSSSVRHLERKREQFLHCTTVL